MFASFSRAGQHDSLGFGWFDDDDFDDYDEYYDEVVDVPPNENAFVGPSTPGFFEKHKHRHHDYDLREFFNQI